MQCFSQEFEILIGCTSLNLADSWETFEVYFFQELLERGTSKLNKKKKNFPIKMMVFLKSPFPIQISRQRYWTNAIFGFCQYVGCWYRGKTLGSHAEGPGFESGWQQPRTFFIFPPKVAGNLNSVWRLWKNHHLDGNFFFFFIQVTCPSLYLWSKWGNIGSNWDHQSSALKLMSKW